MDKQMRSVGIKMNILMGFTMSVILSLVGTLLGGHFTVPSWLVSFVVSLIISLVLGFLVPIKKLEDMACNNCGVNPQSMKGNLVSGLVSNLIYTPIITIIMVILMVGNALKHIPENVPVAERPSVMKVLPLSLIVCLIVGYVVIIIIKPFFLKKLLGGVKKD